MPLIMGRSHKQISPVHAGNIRLAMDKLDKRDVVMCNEQDIADRKAFRLAVDDAGFHRIGLRFGDILVDEQTRAWMFTPDSKWLQVFVYGDMSDYIYGRLYGEAQGVPAIIHQAPVRQPAEV